MGIGMDMVTGKGFGMQGMKMGLGMEMGVGMGMGTGMGMGRMRCEWME